MGMAERHAKSRILYRKYYAHLPTREALMDAAVFPLLGAGRTLFDAGCGDTLALLNKYGPEVSFAVGVDVVTPSEKPKPRTAVSIGDLAALPFRNETFDLIVSRSVVEHLERPRAVFQELARTLRPGGKLIFTTPNKYYYSSLVAGMIPYSWKDFYMRRAFAEECYDHFPVFYRANSRRALRRVAAAAGLRIEHLQALRHFPYYLLFSPMLFRLGMLYDWVVTALRLDGLQSTWLVVMERVER